MMRKAINSHNDTYRPTLITSGHINPNEVATGMHFQYDDQEVLLLSLYHYFELSALKPSSMVCVVLTVSGEIDIFTNI